MLCHVDWSLIISSLQDKGTFIFLVKQSKKRKHAERYGTFDTKMVGTASQWE
jgi:hypothetical protein